MKKDYACTSEDYLATFSTRTGRKVLNHILVELNYFEEAETEEEKIKRNIAQIILRNMGVLQLKNMQEITNALVNIAKRHPIITD